MNHDVSASWLHEKESAWLYRHVAAAQSDPHHRRLFEQLAAAAEEQARVLIRRNKLTEAPEEIVKDMLAHTIPGVLVVAAMVAAIALLQAEGHYTYITV